LAQDPGFCRTMQSTARDIKIKRIPWHSMYLDLVLLVPPVCLGLARAHCALQFLCLVFGCVPPLPSIVGRSTMYFFHFMIVALR
jgi:hypothetical protein